MHCPVQTHFILIHFSHSEVEKLPAWCISAADDNSQGGGSGTCITCGDGSGLTGLTHLISHGNFNLDFDSLLDSFCLVDKQTHHFLQFDVCQDNWGACGFCRSRSLSFAQLQVGTCPAPSCLDCLGSFLVILFGLFLPFSSCCSGIWDCNNGFNGVVSIPNGVIEHWS